MSLFGTGPQVLLDDASGRIDYHPGVLGPGRAAGWFDSLLVGIDWRSERRVRRGRARNWKHDFRNTK